jgi:hypothetical protein
VLPPDDRTRSPYTGYVRAHWEAVADLLLDAVVPYASPGFAQIRLQGRAGSAGAASDGLEGFARTFLLAALRVSGAGGAGFPGLIERYADGLAAGTDPRHEYAWPAITDRSQPIVEAASVALALHETRPWLYDHLAPEVKQRVVDWLAGIIGAETWPCNWVLFRVVVEQFLASVGGPHKPEEIADGLARIEEWYVGDGWYTDGAGQHYDYYCGWAMHLYPVLWARMASSPALSTYRERLRTFLDDYRFFFARDGAPVHQGRSLTYRFAAAAPLWLGALVDATPLAPGATRRLASGVLRHFVDRGAPDAQGLLRLGWHAPSLVVTQHYSGPASPYWASKAFLGLLLPADHPVWTDAEEPAPVETADHVRWLPGPGWLLHSTRRDGIVRLLNHGSDGNDPPGLEGAKPARDDPHYARLSYATHAGPCVAPDAVDGHLAVIAPDGTASRRRRIERIGGYDRFAASYYTDDLPDGAVRVDTATIACGAGEIRVHRVSAPAGFAVREGGYAVAAADPPAGEVTGAAATVSTRSDRISAVVGLHGFTAAGVEHGVDTNAYGRCAATPYLCAPAHPGGTAHYASLVVLGRSMSTVDKLRRAVSLTVDGDLVRVSLPGDQVVEIALSDPPHYARRTPGGPTLSWKTARPT